MIRFVIDEHWDGHDVATRVAHIVCGDGWVTATPEKPKTWQIGRNNDWSLTEIGYCQYELKYRYITPDRQRMLNGMGPFLHYTFNRGVVAGE